MTKVKIWLFQIILISFFFALTGCKNLFDNKNEELKVYSGDMTTTDFENFCDKRLTLGESVKIFLSADQINGLPELSQYYRDETETSIRLSLQLALERNTTEEDAKNQAKQLANWLVDHNKVMVAVRTSNYISFYAKE